MMNVASYPSSLPRITLLGSFRIAVGNNPITLRTRKSAAALAYLIVCGERGAAPDELIQMLWPNSLPRSGRHSFSQAVYHLKQVVGRTAIVGTDLLTINASSITADIWDVDEGLRHGNVLEVLQHYGTFLLGLDIESPSYDAWRHRIEIDLSARTVRAVAGAIKGAESSGDWRLIDEISRAALPLFPFEKTFWESRILAILKTGATAAAKSIYDDYVEAMYGRVEKTWDSYLGVRPTPIALRESTQPRDVGFVGRVIEIAALIEAFGQAASGTPQIITISGRAGIGKTMLGLEFCKLAAHQGARVIRTVGYEAEQHIPYNLLAELLASGCALTDCATLPSQLVSTLAELVPELNVVSASIKTPLGPAAAQRRLFEASTRLFWAVSDPTPVLICIDDIHWADETTLQWLGYFVRRTTDKKVMILLAARSSHIEREALIHTQRASSKHRILHLNEFTTSEATKLVRASLSESSSPELIDQVVSLSGGHPLLLSEILKASSREARIDTAAVDLSFVESALQLLPTNARRVAETLAVIALPTPVRRLSLILQAELDSVIDDTTRLKDFCILDEEGTLRFTHDLLREAVARTLSPEKRRSLHRSIAIALELAGDGAAALSYHFHWCGDREKAYRFALEAAAASDLKRAAREANYYYGIALANAPSERDGLSIKAKIADSLMKAGEYESANRLFSELIAVHSDEPRVCLKWLSLRLVNEHAMKANSRSQRLLQEARRIEHLAISENDHEAMFQSLRIQLILEFRLLDATRDPGTLSRLVTISERHPVTEIGTDALRIAATAMSFHDIHSSTLSIRTALAWADQLSNTDLLIKCLRAAGAVYYNCGRFGDAKEAYERALATVQATGAILYMPYVMSAYASLLMELDCDDKAHRLLQQVLSAEVLAEESEYTTALCNQAVHAYQRGMYLQCSALAAEAFSDEVAGTWLEIALRGVWGLSLLELGSIQEAKDQTTKVERLLPKSNPYGDISYGYVLINRMRLLQRREQALIPALRDAIHAKGDCDPIGTSRLKLALAESVIQTNPRETSRIVEEVRRYALCNGLKSLGEQCERVSRKFKRSYAGRTRPDI